MIIGITGSSGAGKSTVCEILKNKYGAVIIDADKIAKQLSKNNAQYLADIVKQFGREILLGNGELNRTKLAEIIYNSPEKREILNNCTFKHIQKEIKKEIDKVENVNKVIDAPLLFEAELESLCQFVICVITDNKEVQVQRIIKRDGITRKQAIARLNAQKSNEFYTTRSKYAIINNGKLEEIEEQIKNIFARLEIY